MKFVAFVIFCCIVVTRAKVLPDQPDDLAAGKSNKQGFETPKFNNQGGDSECPSPNGESDSWGNLDNSKGPEYKYEAYKGDEVLQVVPQTVENQKRLEDIIRKNRLDLWKEAKSPNSACHFRVPLSKLDDVKTLLKQDGMSVNVFIPDVEKVLNRQFFDNGGGRVRNGAFNYTRYNRYFDILIEMAKLACKNKDIVQMYPRLGDRTFSTFERRPMHVLMVSQNVRSPESESTKPVIFIDGGMHAREWISVASSMFMIKTIIDGYRAGDQRIVEALQKYVFVFLPVFNPDGYEWTFISPQGRLWRKTRTRRPGQDLNDPCIGIDANRNFNISFQGSSDSDPCFDTYPGITPLSDLCVINFVNIISRFRNRIKVYYNLHSYGQFLFFPWAYKEEVTPELFTISLPFAQAWTAEIKKRYGSIYFGIPPAFLFGPIGGTALDWMRENMNLIYSFAIELRDTSQFGFLLPPDQIEPTALETWDAILNTLSLIPNP